MAVGGVSAADRGCLAAVLPLLMLSLARTSAMERGRTARRMQGTDRGTTRFRQGELHPDGLLGGSAALVVCRIPYNIIENSSNQLHRTVATHSKFWSCSLCILVLRSIQWVSLTVARNLYLHAPAARNSFQSNFDRWRSTLNPKPEPLNPKPYILHPKP